MSPIAVTGSASGIGGRRVSWRTVPALAAGVLATLAGALAVWCRGPGLRFLAPGVTRRR